MASASVTTIRQGVQVATRGAGRGPGLGVLHLAPALALRALLRNRLSLALLLLAVAAGVGFQIPNAANLNGYSAELLRQGVTRATGHVLLTPRRDESLQDIGRALTRLRAQPGVRAACARLVHAGVLFKGEAYQPLRVVGIDPGPERAASDLCASVTGRCITSAGRGRALLGARVAAELGLRPGDRARLVLPRQELGELKLERITLRVAGVLRGGGGFTTDHDVFLPRSELEDLVGWHDEATALAVYLERGDEASRQAPRLEALVPGARAEPWWRANRFVASAIEGNRTLLVISMTMVIFAVGIPVLALLYIHVLHDRREIAVLAAIGFGRSVLFVIYLLKAALVGLGGAALGLGVGLGLCALFRAHPIFSYEGFVVRPVLDAAVVAIPVLILLAVTLVAGVAPALLAARANPALALKEER